MRRPTPGSLSDPPTPAFPDPPEEDRRSGPTTSRATRSDALPSSRDELPRGSSDSRPPAAMFVVAAFAGLRQGELLTMRRRHVDFANPIPHARRNLPAGTSLEEAPKSHRSFPVATTARSEQ